MKITFLGTRGGYPMGGQTSCARIEGNCGSLIIDLGSTLLFEHPDWVAEADHVLMTHLHPDHIAHLASLVIARLNLPAAEGDVSFVAPESIRDYMQFSGLEQVPGWRQKELVPSEWGGFTLSAIQTRHPRKNHAYRIYDGNTTLVWTGDCSYSEELADFCAGTDVLVCEASMKEEHIDNALEWGHMTPGMFARLMNEAQPALAVSTHYTELEPADFAAIVRPLLNENIELVTAFDGFELVIPVTM
ncbi:MAG: MBL fold metallo-hydrolase [Pontiellaceae bacterium]|nr:MBL fold metallo-hydrolase [Pontiellaceae bacterium]MBN2784620.1 MBL fold metallo-hydrolase [Pontiellaceae bacterium]